MARPVDSNAQYRVKPHTTKGYVYASTQPHYSEAKKLTGLKRREDRHTQDSCRIDCTAISGCW